MQNNRIEKLKSTVEDYNNNVFAFSFERTSNGFVISLGIIREEDGNTVRIDPTFSFEEDVPYESVVDIILANVKLHK